MVYFAPWKIVTILVVCLLAFLYAAPNLLARSTAEAWQAAVPAVIPSQTVNLGLDLQGGCHLLLSADIDEVLNERLAAMEDNARRGLNSRNVRYRNLGTLTQPDPTVLFTVREPSARETRGFDELVGEAREVILTMGDALTGEIDFTIDGETGEVRVIMTEVGVAQLIADVMGQSIEVVRRRVDETGTREPLIQRQGIDRLLLQLPGTDNCDEVKDLIGQPAKMSFHLVDLTVSQADLAAGQLPPGSMSRPTVTDEVVTGSLPILRRADVTGDMLDGAGVTTQNGLPAVSFRLNALGSDRFCQTTSENIGEPFAILLDDEIISAPEIQSAICGGNGVITGVGSVTDAAELALLLRSGALPASLTILEERTVGPTLGADSIAQGQVAALVGMVLVVGFMIVVYGLFGAMAVAALVVNVALIFALLSTLQATLTLPGIAGIVLTIGMAVDANVLIFERIKEELRIGRTPISAIDAGYGRAMTTIIDSNLTTLIAAVILFAFGTGPIRGFAVTLAIGIATSMFSAIWVTRLMVVTWLRQTKPKEIPI